MSNITATSKQYFKKLFSPLAIALLVLSALSLLLIPHKALAVAPDFTIDDCSDFTTIAADPATYQNYYILLGANNLNCAAELTAPLFSDSLTPFMGTFDGGGNTLLGLAITGTDGVGLFGFTDSATIKDLTVAGTVQGDNCVGSIVGDATNTNLEGNTSSVNITAKLNNGFGFGGIVGCYYSNGSGSFAVRTNSYSGTITIDVGVVDYIDVGGVVGHSVHQDTATLNADNNQFVGILDKCYSRCGGVIGYPYAFDGSSLTINSNTNTGTIQDSGYTIGGVIGYGYLEDSASLQSNSNNFAVGADILNASGMDIGGQAGVLEAYDEATIQTNYNQVNGTINGGSDYSGGLVGEYYCYNYLISGNACEMSYNTNNSDITASNYAGGMIGYLYNNAHFIMQHNTNNGEVSGDSRIGGMIGYAYTQPNDTDYGHSIKVLQNESNGLITIGITEGAGIIGRMEYDSSYGNANGLLQIDGNTINASITGDITNDAYYIAGIIGYLTGSTPSGTDTVDNISVSNNVINGAVTGSQYLAGVIGEISHSNGSCPGCPDKTNLKVDGNAVNGEITSVDDYVQVSAGIVGHATLPYVNSTFNDNEVNAGITFEDTFGNNTGYIGGIVAELDITGGSNQISRNFMAGDITAEGLDIISSVGGIIGDLNGQEGGSSTIKNNFNYGNITINSTNSSLGVGGIIGQSDTTDYDLFITENLNEGDVEYTGSGDTDAYGGVLANAIVTNNSPGKSVQISRNINRGDITSKFFLGGVIGDLFQNPGDSAAPILIQDNYNFGDITATGSGFIIGRGGGLIGWMQNNGGGPEPTLKIERNYSNGTIEDTASDGNTGGLIGLLNTDNDLTAINSSFSTGEVIGGAGKAAMVGYLNGEVFEDGNDLYYYNPLSLACANNGTIVCAPAPATQFTTGPSLPGNLPINTWDFVNVWGYQPTINGGLPCLQWENPLCAPDADTDGDGISNSVEGAAPNGGDANDDNFPDYLQSNVTSLVSPVSSKYVVVQTTCTQNSSTSNSAESTTSPDTNYDYPSGLSSFTTTCPSEGYTAQITYFAYGSYDPTKTSLRKFNPTTGAYTTLLGADLSTTTIGGQSVLKGIYSITDGGAFDLDGTANGVIVDPVGAAIAATIAPNTGYGWGE